VSFDLIYARPGQTEAAWRAELERALGFGTGHLSLYQLTIEAGTRFATLAREGRLTIPDGDTAAGLYELTQALAGAAGLPAYEISNHARPGEESRHNLVYWRYGDYLGIGPGAHGRRGGRATSRHRKPENWLNAIGRDGHGIAADEALTPEQRSDEALLMGLRLAEGIDAARFARNSGCDLWDIVDRDAVRRFAALGLVEASDERLAATAAGRQVLDRLLGEIALA